jgi:hypothetical protein
MPLFAAAFAFVLKSIAVGLVVRVLLSLGFAVTTFIGADALITAAEQELMGAFNALPATVAQLLAILKIDYAVSVLFAGYTFKVTYGLLTRFGPRLTPVES